MDKTTFDYFMENENWIDTADIVDQLNSVVCLRKSLYAISSLSIWANTNIYDKNIVFIIRFLYKLTVLGAKSYNTSRSLCQHCQLNEDIVDCIEDGKDYYIKNTTLDSKAFVVAKFIFKDFEHMFETYSDAKDYFGNYRLSNHDYFCGGYTNKYKPFILPKNKN
jgi:hypothetical protein